MPDNEKIIYNNGILAITDETCYVGSRSHSLRSITTAGLAYGKLADSPDYDGKQTIEMVALSMFFGAVLGFTLAFFTIFILTILFGNMIISDEAADLTWILTFLSGIVGGIAGLVKGVDDLYAVAHPVISLEIQGDRMYDYWLDRELPRATVEDFLQSLRKQIEVVRRGYTPNDNRIECPHCAELIKPNATICRYCQREVDPLSA